MSTCSVKHGWNLSQPVSHGSLLMITRWLQLLQIIEHPNLHHLFSFFKHHQRLTFKPEKIGWERKGTMSSRIFFFFFFIFFREKYFPGAPSEFALDFNNQNWVICPKIIQLCKEQFAMIYLDKYYSVLSLGTNLSPVPHQSTTRNGEIVVRVLQRNRTNRIFSEHTCALKKKERKREKEKVK